MSLKVTVAFAHAQVCDVDSSTPYKQTIFIHFASIDYPFLYHVSIQAIITIEQVCLLYMSSISVSYKLLKLPRHKVPEVKDLTCHITLNIERKLFFFSAFFSSIRLQLR